MAIDEKVAPALEMLREHLEVQLRELTETKRLINALRKLNGDVALYEEGSESLTIRADQFYGKDVTACVAGYLRARNQACDGREILAGLLAGGFDFDVLGWQKDDRLRSLAITLAKNPAEFHRLPNGSFGMTEWYDRKFLEKATARRMGQFIADVVKEVEEAGIADQYADHEQTVNS